MKKALKYFMENKAYNYRSVDYDDYKRFMRYSTNGHSLVIAGDRDSIARIKKKYRKIWNCTNWSDKIFNISVVRYFNQPYHQPLQTTLENAPE